MGNKKKRFSYANLREIASGIKRIWELETVLPSSTKIIEDVDLTLEALEMV